MSNRLYIEVLECKNKDDEVFNAVYIHDDYASTFVECPMPDVMQMTDMQLFDFIYKKADSCGDYVQEQIHDMIDNAYQSEKSININNTWYDYEDYKSVIESNK